MSCIIEPIESKRILLPEIKFTPELQFLQKTETQNGVFYQNKEMFDKALECFDAAFQLKSDDYVPVIKSSQCHYELGDIEVAKEEVERAIEMNPANDLTLHHHHIDCVYSGNNFESSLVDAYRTLLKRDGIFNTRECRKRIYAIRSTMDYTIGENAGSCLLNLRRAIKQLDNIKLSAANKSTKYVCGVSSDPVITRKIKKPLLKHRIEQNQKRINRMYLGDPLVCDYDFIKQLRHDERLHVPQCKFTNARVLDIVEPAVKRIKMWRDILRKRQPLYSKKFAMINSAKKAKQYDEALLYREQIQTRRDIFKQLVKVRELAKNRQLDELIEYTTSILQDYYAIKPKRVFPRIFEFRNELCNIVGLAYLNEIKVPRTVMDQPQYDRVAFLLMSKKSQEKTEVSDHRWSNDFGNHEDFDRAHEIDKSYLVYKHRAQNIEQLITTLDEPIEKCFLNYELSRMHATQMKIDDSRTTAQRVIDNGKKCGNYVWQYLGLLQIARAHAIQKKYDQLQYELGKMKSLCNFLNETLDHFTCLALRLNQVDVDLKEKEEREKQEAHNREEELREQRRLDFIRKSTAISILTPADVHRHTEILKDQLTKSLQNHKDIKTDDSTASEPVGANAPGHPDESKNQPRTSSLTRNDKEGKEPAPQASDHIPTVSRPSDELKKSKRESSISWKDNKEQNKPHTSGASDRQSNVTRQSGAIKHESKETSFSSEKQKEEHELPRTSDHKPSVSQNSVGFENQTTESSSRGMKEKNQSGTSADDST